MAYKIVMKDECWDYWWALVDKAPGEVGCWGYVTLDQQHQEAYVDTLFIVPQTASAAEVDFMEQGLPYAIEKAATDNRIDDLRFCIHSHGNLDVFYSTTDEDMIGKMGRTTDWFVSCISNKKGKSNGRIDIYDCAPLGIQVSLSNLDFCAERSVLAAFEADRDFDDFVKKPAPKVTKTSTSVGTYTPPAKSSVTLNKSGDEKGHTFWKADGTKVVMGKEPHLLTREELDSIDHWRLHTDGTDYIIDSEGMVVHEHELDWHSLGYGESVWGSAEEVPLTEADMAELMMGGWV